VDKALRHVAYKFGKKAKISFIDVKHLCENAAHQLSHFNQKMLDWKSQKLQQNLTC